MDVDHVLIVKIFEEEINGPIKETFEKQPTKKRPNVSNNVISKFFIIKDHFKNYDVQQKDFLKDLGLLIVKNQLPL